MSPPVPIGLEVCTASPPEVLERARFGLLMNQASLDAKLRYSCDVLADRFPGQLAAIFSPQHGLWSQQQANMIESPHVRHPRLNVPVYSLYSEHRQPTPEMLKGLDLLVVDLQDVGTRVYTFIWTISHCLEACAAANIPVLILDRPNPLGGQQVEGPLLEPAYASFVGRTPIPMRHGLTLAELARLVNEQLQIGAEVHVVPMQGWRRAMSFAETGRTWAAPSPNLPRLEGVQLYPGGVLLEGTNLSEGRGTSTPFEIVGAPFIDAERLFDELRDCELTGVVLRPTRFTPTFDKWSGESCGGVYLHVTHPNTLRPYCLLVTLIATIARLWANDFSWLPPPYEYELEKLPIDILSGSAAMRTAIDRRSRFSEDEMQRLTAAPSSWKDTAVRYWLY